jgi:hypothetical protein
MFQAKLGGTGDAVTVAKTATVAATDTTPPVAAMKG